MILEDKECDIFVASKIGSFKHIKYHSDPMKNTKKCVENLVDIKTLQKEDEITCLSWGNVEQTEILVGRMNQQVQTYNTQQAAFTKTQTADFGTGHIVGLARYKRRLIAGLSSGVVKVWSKKEDQVIQTGSQLDRLRSCEEDRTMFATGGKENELKVWRIGDAAPLFTAKNLPNDFLQLRRPVWSSDVCFLEGTLLAECSRYGYVRLYDTRAQRRPVCNVEFKMAATCISRGFTEKQVLVGFGRGQLHLVDLRAGRPDKGYKGCAGAVSAAAAARGRVVSVGLDRHVRVHDGATKQLLYKQYLTSKLTALLLQTASSTPLRASETEDVAEKEEKGEVKEEDELDELFESMDTILEKPKKKKSVISDAEPEAKKKKSKPSTEGSTVADGSTVVDDSTVVDGATEDEENTEVAIRQLLRSTEKKKKKMEQKKKEKRAKSVFHNA